MESRRSRNACGCNRSRLPFSSTFLFLSLILPSSSYAQLTTFSPPTTNPTPTTFSTSTSPPPSSSSPPPDQSQPTPPPPTPSTIDSSNDPASHAFNYYFLIVAAVAVLFCAGIIWVGRRKKRKAALTRSHGQSALARDVEGWRTRFGVGRAGLGNNTLHTNERDDGLDERGEAPPPYAPGSKPPSIRSEDGARISSSTRPVVEGEVVELRRISGETSNPPRYHEYMNRAPAESIANITRPGPAVTASESVGSMRQLLSNTAGSSQS